MGVEERAARPVCRARGTLTGRGRAYAYRAVSRRASSSRAVEKAFRASVSLCAPLPPTYVASVLMVARSTPHAEARGSILRELL